MVSKVFCVHLDTTKGKVTNCKITLRNRQKLPKSSAHLFGAKLVFSGFAEMPMFRVFSQVFWISENSSKRSKEAIWITCLFFLSCFFFWGGGGVGRFRARCGSLFFPFNLSSSLFPLLFLLLSFFLSQYVFLYLLLAFLFLCFLISCFLKKSFFKSFPQLPLF